MNPTNTRLSRLRGSSALRGLVRETSLQPTDLIQPLFIHHGQGVENPISSMPGQSQLSVDRLPEHAKRLADLGITALLLFGIPANKDNVGSDTWDDQNGIIQQGLRTLKHAVPDLLLVTDVCFCEYTDHGHCGVLAELNGKPVLNRDGAPTLDHDATAENLARQAVSHARAGADILAPSGMIDHSVAAIRTALDAAHFKQLPIMAYSAKYASAFYGPFRDAAQGSPQFGDRRTHQMDPANTNEALREIELDLHEGADIVMIKPALPYLDIIRRVKDTFAVPTAAYNVSGEYAMIKAAADKGWLNEKETTLEILRSIKRAGADIIITYHAADAADWLTT